MVFKFFAYRDWAINSINCSQLSGEIFKNPQKINWQKLSNQNFVFVFIGWSWIVPSSFVQNELCLCFHPSDLPEYRGGSPIQHQVIDGVENTFASMFRMTELVDDGPVLAKVPINLSGSISDIFGELTRSAKLCLNILSVMDDLGERCDAQKINTRSVGDLRRRRTSEMSIITLTELEEMSFRQRCDFIRCQQSPYPVAKLKLRDGTYVTLSGAVDESNDDT